MHPILRNIIAVIAGFFIGSVINMGIINLSSMIIPPPDGIDVTNMESLKANMHLFGPQHFIMPFLAHALGTLAGAFIAALIAATHKMKFAIGIAIPFLIGGIASVFLLPAPIWFSIVDILFAYIPMGILGGKLAIKLQLRKIEA